MNEAIMTIGMAQHPIADDTSPQHYNFQVWHGLGGPCSLLGALWHHLKENPSEYDNVSALSEPPAQHVRGIINKHLDAILME